jgi:ankyrin repeat protein
MLAAEVGHVEAVRLLLEKGADIRAVDGVSGSLSLDESWNEGFKFCL